MPMLACFAGRALEEFCLKLDYYAASWTDREIRSGHYSYETRPQHSYATRPQQ